MDALSQVPISHSRETIQSLLEGAIIGAADRGEAKASEELWEEHECLSQEARVQAAKLEPMHIVDWKEAQEADAALARCCKWLHLRKDMPLPPRDAFLKECLGVEVEMEQGKMFFHICNSLVLSKGLMYVSTTPKGETEGVLALSFWWVNATWCSMVCIVMPDIRANKGPWLLLRRDFGGL